MALRLESASDLLAAWLVHLEAMGYSGSALRNYRRDVWVYLEFLKTRGIPYDQISPNNLIEWIAALRRTGIVPSSINIKLAAVRSWYKWLKVQGYIHDNPTSDVRGVKKPKRIPRHLSEEQVKLLFAEAKDPKKALALDLLYSGLRVSEVTGLRWEDFGEQIRVMGKGSKERLVPLLPSVKALVDEAPKVGYGPLPVSDLTIWRWVKECAIAAGLPKETTCHRLRHSCATHLLNRGVPLEIVQEILGHEDISTTRIYAQVSKERVKAAFLSCHPHGPPPPATQAPTVAHGGTS